MNIELNRRQLDEIAKALEFYFRFFLGQPQHDDSLRSLAYDKDRMDRYEAWVQETKKLFFDLEYGASFSYNKVPLTYEILGKINQKTNQIDGIDNVRSQEPLKCTKEPFIIIED